jgi:RNA polymerase sigma-70 factor, ECF subfamily
MSSGFASQGGGMALFPFSRLQVREIMIDESPIREPIESTPHEVMLASPGPDPARGPINDETSGDVAHRTYTPREEMPGNDLVLIEQILAGKRELFLELVRPYQKLVYSMAVTIVKNEHEAEDVSQEALFKAFKNLSQFRGECKFSTWIIQITLNEARHRIRKKQRAPVDSIDQGFENEEGDYMPIDLADWREIPSEALQRKELHNALETAIANLKEIYRDVLVLRDIEHLSVAETARMLDISEASVKTRLLRARLQMRDALAPGFDGYWNTGSTTYKRVRPF